MGRFQLERCITLAAKGLNKGYPLCACAPHSVNTEPHGQERILNMTNNATALLGAAMIVIGSIKTWLHMGSVPLLALPTCNGETLSVTLGNAGLLERAHCWGCYMLAVGIFVVAFAIFRYYSERRSVAC